MIWKSSLSVLPNVPHASGSCDLEIMSIFSGQPGLVSKVGKRSQRLVKNESETQHTQHDCLKEGDSKAKHATTAVIDWKVSFSNCFNNGQAE